MISTWKYVILIIMLTTQHEIIYILSESAKYIVKFKNFY